MKTKLVLAFATAAMLGTTGVSAGPGPRLETVRRPPRMFPAPIAELKCDKMTVNTGGKYDVSKTVACKDYAKVRPAECRLACTR